MKKCFVLIISLLLFTSCSDASNVSKDALQWTWKVDEIASSFLIDTWALELSWTRNVKPDLTKSYYYLDSLKKAYDQKTFWELISETPYTIVYFYPKDGTPNCTIQALDFSAMREKFLAKGYQILWVSQDSLESHKKFADKNELTIKLLQDKKWDLLKEFWAEGPLTEYGNGKELSNVIRSTFIIDKNGKALYAFRDVIAPGHAQRVYDLISKKETTK